MHRAIVSAVLALGMVSGGVWGAPLRGEESPHRYDLRGQVVSVNRQERSVLLAHDAIPGYMDAMTMTFALKEKWAPVRLRAGDRIRATLVVTEEEAWLEGVAYTRGSGTEMLYLATPEAEHVPQAGEEVPDFTLVNQDEQVIRLHQYHEQVLLLTFIYTRCPIPRGCPQMVGLFAEIAQALAEAPELQAKTHLLSITFDPEHDTPALLREYGGYYVTGPEGFRHWEFASGTKEEVQAVTRFFGVRSLPTGELITHLPRTAVISPEGRVVKVYTDNSWTAADLLRDVRQVLTRYSSGYTSSGVK